MSGGDTGLAQYVDSECARSLLQPRSPGSARQQVARADRLPMGHPPLRAAPSCAAAARCRRRLLPAACSNSALPLHCRSHGVNHHQRRPDNSGASAAGLAIIAAAAPATTAATPPWHLPPPHPLPPACAHLLSLCWVLQGTLRGYDQATNLILDECHERVYSSKARGFSQRPWSSRVPHQQQPKQRRPARPAAPLLRGGRSPAGPGSSPGRSARLAGRLCAQRWLAGSPGASRSPACPRAHPLPPPHHHSTAQSGVEQLVLGLYVIRGDNM